MVDTYTGSLDVEEPPALKITNAYYSLDGCKTWIEIERGSTIYIPEGADLDFKVHIRNEGGISYSRVAWAQKGYECGGEPVSIGESNRELSKGDEEDIVVATFTDISVNQSYSLHINESVECPSEDQFNFYISAPTSTPTPTPKTTAEFACVQKWETPKPDTLSEIILSSVKNTGGKAGKVYAAAAELDSTGTVIDEFYRGSTDLNAGQCASFRAEQPTRTGYLSPATCGPCPWGGCIYINKPEGTYYYGVKTWGEDEAEPSYPVPDASDQPANAKAWSFVCELPTPTPAPTRPPITGECVFPRIITGTLTPRLDTGIIFYRIRCIIDKWI